MLTLSGISKIISGEPLISNGSLQVYAGEKVGLVGPNGAGKTTLFRLVTGEDQPDSGSVALQNDTRMAYFSQKVGEMRGRSALAEVLAGHEKVHVLAERLASYEDQLSDPNIDPDTMQTVLEKMGDDQTLFEKMGGFALESAAETILTGLGIEPSDHHKPVEHFSSGWKMRIALAKVLIVEPDLILMDEPTNYLDMETILWLESWLKSFKGAILLTTHDRDFMNGIVNRIVEVARGSITSFSGNYDFYEKEKAVRRVQNESEFNRQQSMLKKEEAFIARFKARASHAAQVQSRVKMIDKIDKVELISDDAQMRIALPSLPRGGNDVIAMQSIEKVWPRENLSPKVVFSGLSATVHRHDRIAVVGMNGAGKSTFLKVLCGQTAPTAGSVAVGPTISIGYFGQSSLEELDPSATIFEILQQKLPRTNDASLRNLLAAFLFSGDDVFKKISVLSGGEKTRVILSYLLSIPFNCILLDEPTNHLDIGSREVLLEALLRYEGTLMFVSHDRFFLRAIANRVFEVDKGSITSYDGDYRFYLSEKLRLGRSL